MRWGIAAAVALLIAGLTVTLMLQARPSLPTVIPTVDGEITRIDERARILVEAEPGRAQGDKCWFAITPQTRILRETGGRLTRAGTADLISGIRVQAWADGGILKSYPCQATAKVILIEQ